MSRPLNILFALLILAIAIGFRIGDPPVVADLRHMAFDSYQRIQPRRFEPTNVVVIDIDDESLRRHGQWPWPRRVLAQLLNRLNESDAAVVAFDMVFAEPDRLSPEDSDLKLAQALSGMPTAIGYMLTPTLSDSKPLRKARISAEPAVVHKLAPFEGAVVNLAAFEGAAHGIGALNVALDRDGGVRRVPLVHRLRSEDEPLPSLAAEVIRLAQDSGNIVIDGGADGRIKAIRIGRVPVATDDRGAMWLYDTGHEPERFIPAWQVLQEDFARSRVAGKVVLVGTSAAGLNDFVRTPLEPAMPGVEVLAQMLEQIVTGDAIARPPMADIIEIAVTGLVGIMLIVVAMRFGGGVIPLAAMTTATVVVIAAWQVFSHLGWLIDPVFPVVTVILTALPLAAVLGRTRRRR